MSAQSSTCSSCGSVAENGAEQGIPRQRPPRWGCVTIDVTPNRVMRSFLLCPACVDRAELAVAPRSQPAVAAPSL